jgi:hypothetical protein
MARFRRQICVGVVAVLFVGLASHSAWAEKRVALIVGNSNYRSVARLPNPEKDASAMAALFKDAGFDTVVEANNAGNLDFKRAIRKFEDAAAASDIAVIYYAGHGIEFGGVNYLIPIDAKLASDRDVDDETVSLNRLLDAVEGAKRLRLIVLDACRDNPFIASMKRIHSSRGIAYAAKAGSTAEDGDGAHSPFTTALLDNLIVPGLDIRLALGRVRDEVMKMTNGRQEPFVYGSLGGAIVSIIPVGEGDRGKSAVPAERWKSQQANFEITFWNSIKGSKNPRLFEAYLRRYPTGAFADIAHITLDGLKAAALSVPSNVKADGSPIIEPALIKEVRDRLYELNFDPGPADGSVGKEMRVAIQEFERQSKLTPTGTATQGLLRRLREIGGLKPWGAIVYGKQGGKWGMSWGEDTRKEAVARARASCGKGDACQVEISFFGTECGAFAYSGSSWAIVARDEIRKAKDAAIADCGKRGNTCRLIASVCADGAERYAISGQ